MSDKPQDFAAILETQYAAVKTAGKVKPRFKMCARNRRKLERIRQKVRLLRGQ